ncbi:MAG: hypothetical protein V7L11_27765 [Nostoc sp.]|uniref:hypothetical protein n=1 Tax=Nostoc sp. TaxID=1180 RepID=UPI002FFC3143
MNDPKREKESFSSEVNDKERLSNYIDVDYSTQTTRGLRNSKNKNSRELNLHFKNLLITVLLSISASAIVLLLIRPDIFREVIPKIEQKSIDRIVVINVTTQEDTPIENAEVNFINSKGEELTRKTNKKGSVNIEIPINNNSEIKVRTNKFKPQVIQIDEKVNNKFIMLGDEKVNNKSINPEKSTLKKNS